MRLRRQPGTEIPALIEDLWKMVNLASQPTFVSTPQAIQEVRPDRALGGADALGGPAEAEESITSDLLATLTAVSKVDLAATWADLSQETQRMLGMSVIALGLSRVFNSILPGELAAETLIPLHDAKAFFDVGSEEALCVIAGYIEKCVLGGDIGRLTPPSVATLGIRQCWVCGCTYDNGRTSAFTWSGPTLCTECVTHYRHKLKISPRAAQPDD